MLTSAKVYCIIIFIYCRSARQVVFKFAICSGELLASIEPTQRMNYIKIERNEFEYVCFKHDSPKGQNRIKVNMHIDMYLYACLGCTVNRASDTKWEIEGAGA